MLFSHLQSRLFITSLFPLQIFGELLFPCLGRFICLVSVDQLCSSSTPVSVEHLLVSHYLVTIWSELKPVVEVQFSHNRTINNYFLSTQNHNAFSYTAQSLTGSFLIIFLCIFICRLVNWCLLYLGLFQHPCCPPRTCGLDCFSVGLLSGIFPDFTIIFAQFLTVLGGPR